MSDYVWLTNFETSDGPFRNYVPGDPGGYSLELAANMNERGKIVPKVALPTSVRPARAKGRKLGELNVLPGLFILIGKRTADVVSNFDLGEGALHPIPVLDHKGAIISEDQFFFWNYGNVFTHLLPDVSENLEKSNYGHEEPGEHIFFPPVIPKDDTIALSRECLNGPDVWVEKFLSKGTLLSDRLMQALKAAKLDKYFEPIRCRVI